MPRPDELNSAREQIASESNGYYTWSQGSGWRAGSAHPTRQAGGFLSGNIVERLEERGMERAMAQESMGPAREDIAAETGGRYEYTEGGGWRAGPEHETPTGGFIAQRQREILETRAQRRQEATPAPAEPEAPARPEPPGWVGRDRAADILGVTPGVATRWGGEGRYDRRAVDNEYQYSYMDVAHEAALRENTERAEAAGQAPPTWRERIAGGFAAYAEDTSGSLREPIAHGQQLLSAGLSGAQSAGRSVVNFVQRTLQTGLSAAAGAAGAGAARIGQAATQLITRGLEIGARTATQLGGAVVSLLTGALSIVGTGATIALGGALIGLFTGAIAAIGVGLANAVSETVGAVADSAEQALSGVVSILQDLTRLGNQFSEQGFGLRALGGMEPGQDLQTLLFGQATGADLGGMMSSWGSRPEFMQARFSALGMQYDPSDVPGSMMQAAGRLRQMPDLLQAPMANVVGGGQGDALLRMAHMPQGQLAQSAGMAAEMAQNRNLLRRIFERMQPAMNRISALSSGLRLQVLDATLPVIETAVTGLYDLWRENRGRIESFLEDLPELAARGVQVTLEAAADSIDVFIGVYRILRQIWDWARGTLGPIFLGIADAVGLDVPASLGGGGGVGAGGTRGPGAGSGYGGSTAGPGGAPATTPTAGNAGGLRGQTEEIVNTVKGMGQSALEHPIETLAGVGTILGGSKAVCTARTIAGMFPQSALASDVAMSGGAASVAAPLAIGTAAGVGGGMATELTDNRTAQSGIGAGSVLAAAGAAAPFGPVASGIAALTTLATGLGTISSQAGEAFGRGRARREEVGATQMEIARQQGWGEEMAAQRRAAEGASMTWGERVAGWITPGATGQDFAETRAWAGMSAPTAAMSGRAGAGAAGPRDPVERAMRQTQDWLRDQAERFDPENIKQAIKEGQKEAEEQAEGRDLGTLNVGVEPSPEFAAQMEYQQSLQMFRSIQLAVS